MNEEQNNYNYGINNLNQNIPQNTNSYEQVRNYQSQQNYQQQQSYQYNNIQNSGNNKKKKQRVY